MLVFKLEQGFRLFLFAVAFVQMRLPQQFGLGLAREAKSPASDEQNELFQGEWHALDEVIEADKWPVGVAFGNETLDKMLLDALQMHKAHENRPTVQCGEVIAAIDARQMDFRTHAPCLVEVEPRLVEPAEIVDYSHLKFKWIVTLQIKALVALHRV